MNYTDIEIRGRDKIKEFKKIALFGAGSYLNEVLDSFKDYNIVAIFDNGIENNEIKAVNGIPLLNPNNCLEQYVDEETAIVMSTCAYQYEISVELMKKYHLHARQIFSMCADYQEERMYDMENIKAHVRELEMARNLLSDENSKQYLDNIVKFKLTHNPLWLMPNPCIIGKYIYQGEITVMVKKGDYIVDGGAFIGDSAEFFLKSTEGECSVYCFEPFAGNYKNLTEMVQEKKIGDRVRTFNFALGNKNDIVEVSAKADISARAHVNAAEKMVNYIYQKKLDDLSEEIKRIDFIKLDIEGDEKNALQGGKNIIRKYKPQMMVSAYHKCEDLWELPLLIHEIDPNYKIYLGHQPHVAFEPEIYVG